MAPRRRTPSVESHHRFGRKASQSPERRRSTGISRQRDRLPAAPSSTSHRQPSGSNSNTHYIDRGVTRPSSRDRTRRSRRERSISASDRRAAPRDNVHRPDVASASDRRRDTSISSPKRRRDRSPSPSRGTSPRTRQQGRRSPPPGPRTDYHHRRASPGPHYPPRRRSRSRDSYHHSRRPPSPSYDRRGPPPRPRTPPRSRYDDYNSAPRGRDSGSDYRGPSISDHRDSTRTAFLDRNRGSGPPPRPRSPFGRASPPRRVRTPPRYADRPRTPPRRSPPRNYPPRYPPRESPRGPSYSRRSSRSPPRSGIESRHRTPERGRSLTKPGTAVSSRKPSKESQRSLSRASLKNKDEAMYGRGGYGQSPMRGGFVPPTFPRSHHGSPPTGPQHPGFSPQQSPFAPTANPAFFQGSPQYNNNSHQPSPHSLHSPIVGTPNATYAIQNAGFRQPAAPASARSGTSPPAPATGPHVRNLSWTPKTGTRGGHAPTLHGANAHKDKESVTPTDENGSQNGVENPFRPASKELRVEDEAGKKGTQQDEAANAASVAAANELIAAQNAATKIRIGLPKTGPPPTAPRPNPLQAKKNPLNPLDTRNPFETSLRDVSRDDERRGPGMRTSSSRFDERDRRAPEPRRDDPPPKRLGPRPALKNSVKKSFYDRKKNMNNVSWSRLTPGFGDRELKQKLHKLRLNAIAQGHPLTSLRLPDLKAKAENVDPDDPTGLEEAMLNKAILEEEAYRRYPKKRPVELTPRLREGEVLDNVFRKEVVAVKHMIRRPQKVLPPEFRNSNVYYRKPGNDSVVGFGTYGKVFKAKHIYKGKDVALKRLRMEAERDGFPITAMREMKILKHLEQRQGQNIIRLHELMYEVNLQNSVACFMVFEYMPHDLTGLLNHPSFTLSRAQNKDMAHQIIDAIGFMHKNGVLHRDIKAANILVSHQGEAKLADFGLARFYDMDRQLHYTNRVVTIWYRAPELLYGQTEYGPAIDVWAVACVIIEIFTRHAIFPGNGKDLNQLIKVWEIMGFPTPEDWPAVSKTEWYFMMRPKEKMPNIFREKYSTGDLGKQTTPALLDLLTAMLQYDPAKRPTCEECLQHPFFTTEEPAAARVTTELETLGDWHEFESKKAKRAKEAEDRVDKDLKEGPPSCGQNVRDERRDKGYRRDLLVLLKSGGGGVGVEKRAANFSPAEPEAKRVRA